MKVLNCQALGAMCEAALDGEPVFVIRAQDKASVDAIKAYVRLSHDMGGRNIIRSSEAVNRFQKWQDENPNRVKSAD